MGLHELALKIFIQRMNSIEGEDADTFIFGTYVQPDCTAERMVAFRKKTIAGCYVWAREFLEESKGQ